LISERYRIENIANYESVTYANHNIIPIIILTTSKAEEDILNIYNLGASSFITKPVTFNKLIDTVYVLGKYWLEIAELPLKVL